MEYLNSQFSILDKPCKSRLNLQKLRTNLLILLILLKLYLKWDLGVLVEKTLGLGLKLENIFCF